MVDHSVRIPYQAALVTRLLLGGVGIELAVLQVTHCIGILAAMLMDVINKVEARELPCAATPGVFNECLHQFKAADNSLDLSV